jgi:hypothetical protein
MDRDPRPILIAGATAVVSGALLALAIARGWLGPDVGRGANFCEAAPGGVIRQPANTFSNLGFVVAGLLIAWHAAGRGIADTRALATFMACVVVLLGPASAAMHATQSALGGHLDMLSMYLIASLAAAYALTRWLRGGTTMLGAGFLGGVAFCELVSQWPGRIPVVGFSGNAAFAFLLVVATVVEVLIMRRGESTVRRAYAYGSLAAILAGFAVWNASKTWLCDPQSVIQGHGIWHVLCAVSAYLLYRYYDSEVTSGGSRLESRQQAEARP